MSVALLDDEHGHELMMYRTKPETTEET